jgi:hypothetical protein
MIPLTPTMSAAYRFAVKESGGELFRFPGGYWTTELWGNRTFGTSTIEGMVKRGVAEYTVWKEGKRGKFPTRVRMKKAEDLCQRTGK